MENLDIEQIKNETRDALDGDTELDYITEELVRAAIANATNADESTPEGTDPGVNYTIYGNNVFRFGGITYWSANTNEAGRGEACGGYSFQSRNIESYGYDGTCDNGQTRYWMEKKPW